MFLKHVLISTSRDAKYVRVGSLKLRESTKEPRFTIATHTVTKSFDIVKIDGFMATSDKGPGRVGTVPVVDKEHFNTGHKGCVVYAWDNCVI